MTLMDLRRYDFCRSKRSEDGSSFSGISTVLDEFFAITFDMYSISTVRSSPTRAAPVAANLRRFMSKMTISTAAVSRHTPATMIVIGHNSPSSSYAGAGCTSTLGILTLSL